MSNLVLLGALCLEQDPQELPPVIGDRRGGAALKATVTDAVNEMLAPVRARRAEYARDLGYVRQVLREATSAPTRSPRPRWPRCRTAMGMRY